MGLLNLQFIILIVKIIICVLPGILAIALLAMSEDSKRSLRNSFCNQVFGLSNAIAFDKFQRLLTILAVIVILYSMTATWFLLLSGYFIEG